MGLKDVKNCEVEKVLNMYEEVRTYAHINSVKKFCEDYLDRCECCGEIVYQDTLEKVKNWDGNIIKCCENCVCEIEQNNNNEDKDYKLADEYYEEHSLGLI